MRIVTSLFLALTVAGCGTPTSGADGAGKQDLAGLNGADLAMAGGDLAQAGPTGADTGAPCAKAADCAGTKPVCVTKDTQGIAWPGGYCVSQCNPIKNDPNDGTNPGCPGGNGTCRGQGNQGVCETACTAAAGANPCTRTGYSCFQACEPTAESQCDPNKRASCPQDGGAPITVVTTHVPDGGIPDGGNADAFTTTTTTNSSRVCTLIGADPVGACSNGCDPTAMQDPMTPVPPCKAGDGCYPSYATGEGFCFGVFGMLGGSGDNTPCKYLNGCDPGFACRTVGMNLVCKQICGGPKNVACPMGQTCKDLSKTVMKNVVGSCE